MSHNVLGRCFNLWFVFSIILIAGVVVLCMLRLDGTFFLPFTNAFGGENAWEGIAPDYCNCSTNGHSTYCNLIGTFNSLLFSTNVTDNYYENILPLIDLVESYTVDKGLSLPEGYAQLNADTYSDAYYTTLSFDKDATFSYCPFETCAMISTLSYDDYSSSVSQYYLQLTDGSCSNSIFTTAKW
jgi:hypothetical protein